MVNDLRELLSRTRLLYEAIHRFDVRAAAGLGIHATDLRCVNALEAGPLPAGEIGARLALTSGSVTALVDRLAAGGYVARAPDPEDRRRSLVGLTPRFRAEADRTYSRLGAAIAERFADADARERETAARVLAILAEAFDEAAPPAP